MAEARHVSQDVFTPPSPQEVVDETIPKQLRTPDKETGLYIRRIVKETGLWRATIAGPTPESVSGITGRRWLYSKRIDLGLSSAGMDGGDSANPLANGEWECEHILRFRE